MDVEFFFELADKSILIGIGGLVLYTSYKYINYFFSKKKIANINNHPLFDYLNYNINIKIPNINIEDYNRDIIFKKFLLIKFKVFSKNFKEALKVNFKNLDDSELRNILITNLFNSIKEYENQCNVIGIPCMVVTKFSKWHSPHIEMVMNAVNYITTSSFYHSQEEKLAIIFQYYITGFNQTIIDAEKTLHELNGELDHWINANPEKIQKIKDTII